VFANVGQSLADIGNLHQLLSTEMLLAFSLLGLLALLPVMFQALFGQLVRISCYEDSHGSVFSANLFGIAHAEDKLLLGAFSQNQLQGWESKSF